MSNKNEETSFGAGANQDIYFSSTKGITETMVDELRKH